MTERTFSIIKPDATERNLTGKVNSIIEGAGLRIVAQKRIRMTEDQAKKFYEVHAERPFYGELVEFMTRAPVVVQVLEGDGRRDKVRKILQMFPGRQVCLLYDPQTGARDRTPCLIHPSMVRELEEMFGKDNVKLT